MGNYSNGQYGNSSGGGGLFGGIVDSLTNLGFGIYDRSQDKKRYRDYLEQMQLANDFAREQFGYAKYANENQAQIQVADLQKAGLSPFMAQGAGGSFSAVGGMPTGTFSTNASQVQTNFGKAIESAQNQHNFNREMKSREEQFEETKNQWNKLNAQRDKQIETAGALQQAQQDYYDTLNDLTEEELKQKKADGLYWYGNDYEKPKGSPSMSDTGKKVHDAGKMAEETIYNAVPKTDKAKADVNFLTAEETDARTFGYLADEKILMTALNRYNADREQRGMKKIDMSEIRNGKISEKQLKNIKILYKHVSEGRTPKIKK